MRFRPVAIIVLLLVAAVEPAAAQSQELIVPVVVSGTVKSPLHFQTILRILNPSTEARTVTVRIYDDAGTQVRVDQVFCVAGSPLLVLPGPELSLQIASNGSSELSSLGNLALFTGWASIRFEGAQTIQASSETALIDAPPAPCIQPICARPSTEIVTSVQLGATAAATEFRATASITDKRESAYALVNPSATQTATIELDAYNSSGMVVDQNTLKIPPLGRISKFLFELLNLGKVFIQTPQRPTAYHGSVRFRSDIPIAVAGLNVLSPEGKLVNLPTK
ncbi:MAG: hypothetical protein ACR2L2_03750 [Acidobacteriota bacterium]